jgi:hypothetical protein
MPDRRPSFPAVATPQAITVSSAGRLLDGLEVSISAFAMCEVRWDATFVLKEDTKTAIHYVLAGDGVAWRMTGEQAALSPHTIMIIPPGSGLAVTSNPDRRLNLSQPDCAPFPDDWDHLTVGEGAGGLPRQPGRPQPEPEKARRGTGQPGLELYPPALFGTGRAVDD